MDLSGPPWHPSHRLDSRYPVVSICVCWPPRRCVYNITSSSLLHRKYLLLLCCLLKVSQYQLALIDTASVHVVKGISQHIRHNHRMSCRLSDSAVCSNSKTSPQTPHSYGKLHISPVLLGAVALFNRHNARGPPLKNTSLQTASKIIRSFLDRPQISSASKK